MSSINFDYDAANERLSKMVLDSEDVVATIEGADGNKRMRSRFVLTNKRLLRFEDNVVGDETDVYRLDNISSVDYSTGLIKKQSYNRRQWNRLRIQFRCFRFAREFRQKPPRTDSIGI